MGYHNSEQSISKFSDGGADRDISGKEDILDIYPK